jgi:hypothetical protein
MSESDRVLVEIVIAAPLDTVWKALREPAEIKRWFGWDYPGLDEEVDLIFAKGADASGAPRTLQFNGVPDRYELEPIGASHTVVRVIRSAPVTHGTWTGVYDDTVEGWLAFTEQLRFALERHPGASRRTIYLNGRATAAGTPLPADALGLTPVAVVPIGAGYSATLATGDAVSGEVRFRSIHQLGLTIAEYGDGLLITTTRTATDKSPHGGGSLCLTTYGMDDREFVRLRDRWSAWWRERYEAIDVAATV